MSARAALANPGFRRYYIGSVSGVNGMWIFRVLLSWAAWDMTGSPGFVGLVAAVSLLPGALAAACIVGFCNTFVGVSLQIGLQAGLEDRLRGRIMSLWMLAATLSTSVMALALSVASQYWGLGPATVVFLLISGAIVFANKIGQEA